MRSSPRRSSGLLSSVHQPAAARRERGYAIVRLALDLGLRMWRDRQAAARRHRLAAGHRHAQSAPNPVARTCCRCRSSPADALADYSDTNVRPPQSSRVRPPSAPHDQPVGVDAIRRVMRDAFGARVCPTAAVTALRHTLGLSSGATRQLDQGSGRRAAAPLAEHLAHLRQARPPARWPPSRCRGRGVRHERARIADGAGRAVPGRAPPPGVRARSHGAVLAQLRPLRQRPATTAGR